MMKRFVLFMLLFFSLSNLCFAGPVDYIGDKLDQQTDKFVNKAMGYAEKAGDWLKTKTINFIWWLTQAISVIGIGWLLSFLCDRDSRVMVRLLVVLCVISLTVTQIIK
jgi:hypothetical protein